MPRTIRVGLIRVLTTDDTAVLAAHGRLLEEHYPALQVVSRCIPDQPSGIHNDVTERRAEPKIVALAQEFAAEGVDVLLISCASDPALKQVRQAVRVPVIGAGSAAALMALSYGRPVGVLGLSEQAPPAITATLGKSLVATVKPAGVQTTLDLLTAEGHAATLQAAMELSRSVGTIVLACTGMSTIGIALEIEPQCELPVVDPVLAVGALALYHGRRQ